jgi:hypothetical protein
MKDKGQVLFKLFVIFSIFIFAYFMADMMFSYLSVCQTVNGQIYCKPMPVIDFLPTI